MVAGSTTGLKTSLASHTHLELTKYDKVSTMNIDVSYCMQEVLYADCEAQRKEGK